MKELSAASQAIVNRYAVQKKDALRWSDPFITQFSNKREKEK